MGDQTQCAFAVEYPKVVEVLNTTLEGVVAEVMEIMEASMPEGSSREAAKKIVKRVVWRGSDKIKLELQKR
jgi:hypothetical protein